MKKIILILSIMIAGAPAVEWDIEQVTPVSEPYNYYPVLALDDQGLAYILYYQWNETPELRMASNATGAWKTRRVTHLTEAFGEIYDIYVDSVGRSYVSYMDSAGPGKYDIFLATDTTGMFVTRNLTDDDAYQFAPVLDIHGLTPNLIYVSESQLWHGFDNGFGFYSEQVSDNYLQEEWYVGTDYVLDPEGGGSAFYVGDDGFLWQARWIVPYESSMPLWDMFKLTNTESFWPSAQGEGFTMHVAYESGFYPNRIRYMKGSGLSWEDEDASTIGPEETMNERPSLALDPEGNPHIVWMRSLQINDTVWQYDLWYAEKTQTGWEEEAITSTPGIDEKPGYGHYFEIDNQGYGHIVWSAPDTTDWIDRIYHAKSKTPIAAGVAQTSPPEIPSPSLCVEGSRIRFELAQSSFVRICLYDASGRKVRNLVSGYYSSGEQDVPLSIEGLSRGVYFVRLENNGFSANAGFVVTR